jgi:TonB-linked SusC/RagA family outer membrane protein
MRKIVLFMLCVILAIGQTFAQTQTVTGKVTDETGNPVVGASVQAKGSRLGTTTDANGNFTIRVPQSVRALIVSSVNFTNQEVAVSNNSGDLAVQLKAATGNLSEVVVVGYGTQKRKDITGAIATVGSADIENKPFSSVDKALQGEVAGLQSVAASGQPGSSQSILIRGVSSITASNAPLWVIDGIPVNTGDAARLQTTSNLLSTLNPNDIQSISVLKDAASQSIYGSRAANGVIIVTTKKGRAGKTRLRFDTEVGKSDKAYENKKYIPLNAEQYLAIAREGLVNLNPNATNIETTLAGRGLGSANDINWYDAVTRVADQQQYNLSLDGGNERTTFYLSGGHFVQEGTTINSKLTRNNGNIRLTHKATDKITLNANINGGFVNQRAPLNGGAFGNPVLTSFFILPTRPIYNADGSYNFTNLGGLHNTIALSEIDKRFLRETSLRANFSADYSIFNNLKFKTSYGGDYNILEEDQYNNPFHGDGAASNGRAFAYYTRYYNWVWTNTLDYQQKLLPSGDLSLNAQVGYESQKSSGYFTSVQNQDFPPTTALTYPSIGAKPTTANATISDYTFMSEFISASLNYKNRYVVSGSFRRDGSSRFGANNRYGNFGSIGATYNVDQESFMQDIRFVSQLKLRASYGVNGNAGIGNYDWLPLYSYGYNYNQTPGSAPSNVGDSNLTWELNKPLNIGIDVGFLKSRLNITADYYIRKSENLLLSVPLSRTSGFNSATRNIGAMENKGLELAINASPVRSRNFDWTIDFNFANNKNKVTSLPGGNDITDPNSTLQIVRVGESIKSFFLREYVGVDPANGDPLWYADATHAATTNVYPGASARVVTGNALPKYFGSLTNNFNVKGFSLEAQFYYNFGNYVYDTWGSYYVASGFGATYNKVVRVLDRWQKPGDITDIPKYIENGNKNFNSSSTFYLNKGDFIRLRNIQLGFNFPKELISKAKLINAFLYVRGTNLWTWVKDKNLPFDPEQGSTSTTNLNVFIPKTVTVGLNLSF